MVLSKDNIDDSEEVKTTAQKRRLRRKKLHAARAASHPGANIGNGVDINIGHTPVIIDTGPKCCLAKRKTKSEDWDMGKTQDVMEPSNQPKPNKDLKKENTLPTDATKKPNTAISPSNNSITSDESTKKGASAEALEKKENKPITTCSKKETPSTTSKKKETKPIEAKKEDICSIKVVKREVKPSSEKKEAKTSSDKKDVKTSTDKKDVKTSTDKKDLKTSTDKKEVKASSEKKEVKASSEKKDVKASSEKKEVKASSEKKDVKAPSEKKEVKALSEKKEGKTSSEKKEAKISFKKRERKTSSEKKEVNTSSDKKESKPSESVGKKVGKETMKENVCPEEQTKILHNVDNAKADNAILIEAVDKSKDAVKAAREAKKLAKQKAKKKAETVNGNDEKEDLPKAQVEQVKQVKESTKAKSSIAKTLKEEVKQMNELKQLGESILTGEIKSEGVIVEEVMKSEKSQKQPSAENSEKKEEEGKSKAELKAERRAKQEAQRAAKQAAQQKAAPKAPAKPDAKPDAKQPLAKSKEEKSPKTKTLQRPKPKAHSLHKDSWLHYLLTRKAKDPLKNIPINSNMHPAIVKLAVQLSSHVITDSNARCIALLDAIKQMVRDFSLPARTEFARGLQAQLAGAAALLRAARAPAAAEHNALAHLRRRLTLLPNNVDEFDAKKTLQEEIDRYIREQIDMAGEAISLAVQKKICNGDTILTYGGSSLVERVLCAAWAAGARFRAVVGGARCGPARGGRALLRRLRARGLPAAYADVAALAHVVPHVQKVLLGAESVCARGAALAAAGSAQLALLARARNVPVLVACETHRFSARASTDAFVYNDIGDPDELIDESDENSPLKDWRSIPNLSLLNLAYDVTPPDLISAVVTELAILPCTSAPVVLRFKVSEFGI